MSNISAHLGMPVCVYVYVCDGGRDDIQWSSQQHVTVNRSSSYAVLPPIDGPLSDRVADEEVVPLTNPPRADLSRVQIESDSELSASNARIAELESKIGQETQLSDNDFNKQIETAQGEKRGLLELIRDKEVENGDLEDLESKLLSAREAERSIRLQAQSTQSEVTLSRSDRDFYAKELEKTLDKLNHNHQSALSSLESLRVQYADLQRDHSDALEKIKSLTEQSIEAEASFQKEIEAQKRVTELMDKRDKQRAKRMEQYEQEWNVRRAELDQREKEMNEILDNELCGSENETNGRWEDSEFTRNSSFMSLAPDTPLAGRQNQNSKEQMKKVKLENAPLLHQQRLEHDRLERECDELTTQLTSSIEEKEEAERKYHSCQLDLDATRRDLELSNSQLRDLSLQIRVLTQENVLRGSGNSSQTIKGDEDDLMADVSDWRQPLDGDDEDIQEIEESKDDEDEDQDEATSKAIDEAHELILKLKSQLQSSQHKLANQRGDHHIEASSTQLEEGLRIGSQQSVEDLDAQFKAYRVEMGVDTKKLNEDLNRSRAELSQTQVLLAKSNAQIECLNEMKNKCHFLQHQVETLTMEREVWKFNKRAEQHKRYIEEYLRARSTRWKSKCEFLSFNAWVVGGIHGLTRIASCVRQDFKEKIKIAVADYQQKLDNVAKEHLEAQVSDLQKQVAIKEERLRVYEGHRRPAALDNGIERLQIEVADLKIELMAAKEDASRAKEHIEQFKAISQSAEAALASLTATHDEYKSAQEAELNQKQHLKRLTQDLSAATTQNSELHRQIESQRAEFEKEKSSLMSRLKELEEVEEVVKTREAELREEVNQHFRSAQESHDRYQAEVQNHAKSLFELKTVKEELEKAQEKITVAQSAAELATTKLNSSQSSWSDQKVVFQREITNVQARAQAAKISNQAIDSIAGSTCSGGEIGHQIELSKLEIRLELSSIMNEKKAAKLLDQINTLNMVRESNVTLREEAQRSERKAKQLEDRLKEMAETLEPLKKELSELKLTVQHYKQEIAILNEDNERWKARNQMILEKYDRIDPAEVQGLRDEITKLKQDLTQTKEEHTDEISALNEELSKVKETMRDKEKDAQNSQDQANIAAAEATLPLRKEKNELEAKLSEALSSQSKVTEVQAMLDSLKAEFEESKANHAKSFIAANRNLTAELSELKAKPPQQTAALLSEEVIEAEVTKRLQEKLSSEVDKENVSNSKEVTEKLLEEKLRETREKADAERQEAIKNAILETTERLKEEYSKSQAEAIEKIKAETISAQGDSKAISEDLIASQVAARVSEIKGELEAAASAKEKEMISKHENELREAEAAANSQASAAETGRPSPEEVQATVRAAVEEAVKARETELKEVNRVALEAAIETAKTKVAAEMNSKVNVVQMQLKRAYAQIAELKKGMTTAQPLPTSSSSAATTLPPNPATNNIPSTSATTNPPSSSTSTTLSTNGPVSMPLAQAPPQATITSANATPNTLATPAIVEPPQRTNAHNTGQNAIAPNQKLEGKCSQQRTKWVNRRPAQDLPLPPQVAAQWLRSEGRLQRVSQLAAGNFSVGENANSIGTGLVVTPVPAPVSAKRGREDEGVMNLTNGEQTSNGNETGGLSKTSSEHNSSVVQVLI
ncbi:hypothetical protein BY996DRAFT_6567800 [Phakopsora pachyrhizi]|nr:hypothetical protein BY996DRAFT_6567800 [Phakopsora pachyrhizi]